VVKKARIPVSHNLLDMLHYTKRLSDLQKLQGGGITPSVAKEFEEQAVRLQELFKRAVRNLKNEGHNYVEIARVLDMGVQVLIDQVDPEFGKRKEATSG
jgi:hypothetical protein